MIHTRPRYGTPWLLYWLGVIGWSLLFCSQVPQYKYLGPRTSQDSLVNSEELGSGRHDWRARLSLALSSQR